MNKILLLFLIFSGFSCKRGIIYTSNVTNDVTVLNKWQILGPFPSQGQTKFLNVDNLKEFGLKELNVTFDEFCKIRRSSLLDSGSIDRLFLNQYIYSGDRYINFNKLFKVNNYTGNVYCGCIIKSSINTSMRLNFSSNDGEKIWLNHELICTLDNPKVLKSYEQYLLVNLKKGDNFLLIKINNLFLNNLFDEWSMCAILEKESAEGLNRHVEYLMNEFNHKFLNSSIISKKDSLKLFEYFPLNNCTLTIQDNELKGTCISTKINNNDWEKDISYLKDGLYIAKLMVDSLTFSQSFYKGDLIIAIKNQISELQDLKFCGNTYNNVQALIFRFNLLMKPENSIKTNFDNLDWERKMIWLYTQLNHALICLKKGSDPFSQTQGGFYRSYVSKIDSNIQYYILHVPSSYNSEKMLPVFVSLPAQLAKPKHFLESFRMANIRLFEKYEDLANKYNMIIIEPNCRTTGEPHIWNNIDEADYFEVIESVKKDYNIDSSRIYLAGFCSGSDFALRLAVRFPDRYPAIALVAPSITFTGNNNEWYNRTQPLNYLENIKDLPILTIHSVLDPHSSIEVSNKLFKLADKHDLKHYHYKRLESEFQTFYTDEHLEEVFQFFKNSCINKTPSELNLSTYQLKYGKSFWITLNEINFPLKANIHASIDNNKLTITKKNIKSYSVDLKTLPYDHSRPLIIIDNGIQVFDGFPKELMLGIHSEPEIEKGFISKNKVIEGPFSDAFLSKFIIVIGTKGVASENLLLQSIADTLKKCWKDRYCNSCIIKKDIDLSEQDIRTSNLILLGNFKSNFYLNKLSGKIPLLIKGSEIQIGDRVVKGDNLAFYWIHPNPLNTNKYLAIIGNNNYNYTSLGFDEIGTVDYFDIANYGWYDYKVWQADNPVSTKISGYFNSSWE